MYIKSCHKNINQMSKKTKLLKWILMYNLIYNKSRKMNKYLRFIIVRINNLKIFNKMKISNKYFQMKK